MFNTNPPFGFLNLSSPNSFMLKKLQNSANTHTLPRLLLTWIGGTRLIIVI